MPALRGTGTPEAVLGDPELPPEGPRQHGVTPWVPPRRKSFPAAFCQLLPDPQPSADACFSLRYPSPTGKPGATPRRNPKGSSYRELGPSPVSSRCLPGHRGHSPAQTEEEAPAPLPAVGHFHPHLASGGTGGSRRFQSAAGSNTAPRRARGQEGTTAFPLRGSMSRQPSDVLRAYADSTHLRRPFSSVCHGPRPHKSQQPTRFAHIPICARPAQLVRDLPHPRAAHRPGLGETTRKTSQRCTAASVQRVFSPPLWWISEGSLRAASVKKPSRLFSLHTWKKASSHFQDLTVLLQN